MKMDTNIRSIYLLFAAITALALLPNTCKAHDEFLHMKMTRSAFESSDALRSFLTNNLESLDTPLLGHAPPFERGVQFTPKNWVVEGSYWEDMLDKHGFLRSSDHFYTVTSDRVPGLAPGLTDATESRYIGYGFLPSPIVNTFVWVTRTNGEAPHIFKVETIRNVETFPNARIYEIAALTNSTRALRDENLAHMLYALGHVLHLNQDMSQPDHVRNDEHKDEARRYIENYGGKVYYKNPAGFPLKPQGWSYWQGKGFTQLLDFWDTGKYIGGTSDALDQEAQGSTKLGLAEFSNGNFLGEDALYQSSIGSDSLHAFPFPELYHGTSLQTVLSQFSSATTVSFLQDGTPINRAVLSKIRDGIFITNHSVLKYYGTVFPNRLAGAIAQVSVTINDPNVQQEYHNILIPKAIEYSAGILDYFFRGSVSNIVVGYDPVSNQFTNRIINMSPQSFYGGTFSLYQDDANGLRTLIAQTNLDGTLYDSSYYYIPSLNTLDMVFPGSVSRTNKLLLVYQGAVGLDDIWDQNAVVSDWFSPMVAQPAAYPDNIVVLADVGLSPGGTTNAILESSDFAFNLTTNRYGAVINSAFFDDKGSIGSLQSTGPSLSCGWSNQLVSVNVPVGDISISANGKRLRMAISATDDSACGGHVGWRNVSVTWLAAPPP